MESKINFEEMIVYDFYCIDQNSQNEGEVNDDVSETCEEHYQLIQHCQECYYR
jgi:hypothetical protein